MEEMDERPEPEFEKAVSSLIVFTCRFLDILRSDDTFKCHPKPTPEGFMFFSGSEAEFYIIPFLFYFDDKDEMHCDGNIICYFDQIPSMSCDLRYFGEKIKCYRIVPCSGYPGFCQLKYEGDLMYKWTSKKYNFSPIPKPYFIQTGTEEQKKEDAKAMLSSLKRFVIANSATDLIREERPLSAEISGPAVKLSSKLVLSGNQIVSSDIVKCYWCPHWPEEAKDWPSRPRNNGWPTAETIQKVVKQGCYIVCVKHRDYNETLPGSQFRFSFSHAEVVLLNSWTPTQQVVYHMLRYFAKKVLIQKNDEKEKKENEALCTYHLKTLMLWTCEKKPAEWWNTNTVVEICRQLLITLSEWLGRRYFQNYFLPTANLISKIVTQVSINSAVEKINNFSKPSILSTWFLKSYCNRFLDDIFHTSEITVDITTINECIKRISEIRKNAHLLMFERSMSEIQVSSMSMVASAANKWNLRSQRQVSDLPTDILSQLSFHSYFLHMASAFLLLWAEYAITCIGMPCDSEFLVDLLTTTQMKCKQICRKCHNFPRPYRVRLEESHVLFLRAQELMEVLTGPWCDPEFMLCSHISMKLLKECLEIRDSKSDCIRHAALAYMAAFYFANGEFHTSLDLCSKVIESQNSSQTTEASNAGGSSYIDKFATLGGFFLLCKYCYFRHWLETRGIGHASFVYRPIFSFANRDFQTLKDLHSAMMGSPDSETGEALNAGCLLYFSDIANITGFYLLWRYCQDPHFLQNHQVHLDLRITPQVFAMYLMTLLSQIYPKHFPETKMPYLESNSELYILDILLIFLMRQTRLNGLASEDCKLFMNGEFLIYQINQIMLLNGEFANEIDIVPLLLVQAMKRMEDFDSMIFQRFGFHFNSIDCYRALYFYKYRRYDAFNRLCDTILEQPDHELGRVMVVPPFDSFFDSDLQCLLGLKTLYHFLYCHSARWNLPFSDCQMKFRKDSADLVQSGSPLMKMADHPRLKSHSFIGRHFLAKYLKLRCLVERSGTDAEICSAISEMNCRFSMELLIMWLFSHKSIRKPFVLEIFTKTEGFFPCQCCRMLKYKLRFKFTPA